MFSPGLIKAALIAVLVFALAPDAIADSHPQISFSRVPLQGGGPDSRGEISGTVSGLENPEQYKVVIYARAYQWYVQPVVEQPLTDIDADGNWNSWTHLGDRYAVLLVRPPYDPSNSRQSLPEVGEDVLAIVEKDGKALR